MRKNIITLQKRLYLCAALILAIGAGSSIYIYLRAVNSADSRFLDDIQQSKMFRHELELFGGKMNLLSNDIMRWFNGLWQGESLAYTVAVITAFIAFVLYVIAHYLPDDGEADA